MKKSLATILILVYLVFSCGVIINFHYCMDRLASTSLFGDESKYCGKCGMHSDDSDGCCRDEVKVVKLDSDQQKAQTIDFVFTAPLALVQLSSLFICQPFQNADPTGHFHNHSPPLLTEQDTYLQNGVFRI